MDLGACTVYRPCLVRCRAFRSRRCGLDRWWAPHDGVIPGSGTKLPYICPMDHVFEIMQWAKKLDEGHFGPNIDFREFSFLENPRWVPIARSPAFLATPCVLPWRSSRLPVLPQID